jgi:O-antigen chain-terminating methyltransferase
MHNDELKQQAAKVFLRAFEQGRRSTGPDNRLTPPDMERLIALIESHLEQAASKYQVRTSLPGRLERLPLLRFTPVRKVVLRIYELLFREQRTAGLAQLNAWRDFLQLYTRNQWFMSHELTHSRDHLQERLDGASQLADQSARQLNELAQKCDANELEIRQLSTTIATQHQNNLHAHQRLEQDIRHLQRMEARITNLEDDLRISRSTVQMQAQWIQFLIDRGAAPATSLPPSPSAPVSPLPEAPTVDNDAARYVAFEDHFRGHPAKVKEQFAQDYLQLLADAGLQAGSRVLDIGCGRGEWLELMREQHFDGHGVDLNPVVCELCRSKALDVLNDDAVAYMARQPAGSLDLITAFHLIEHIPGELLDRLIASARHALRPGGLLILETPNPENFIVGSCNFYNDPTHLNPLPPEPTRFRVLSHGFANVDIRRLHPRGTVDYDALPPGIPAELLERLFVGQDYALVARR